MKLPAATIIATDKITRYLLVPQARGDKSAFLRAAGYTLDNAERYWTTYERKFCRWTPFR
jgi:hypothetical protein